jgi:hypothetical protein
MTKSKRKGFQQTQNVGILSPPVSYLEKIDTTSDRLTSFVDEMLKRGLSKTTQRLFTKLAHQSANVRLAVNLKVVMDNLATGNLDDTLVDGLTPDERMSLLEIDASGMNIEFRRTAHSLLNVDSRMRVGKTLGGLFRDVRTRTNHHIS